MNSIEKALQKQSQKAFDLNKEELQKPFESEQNTQQSSVEKALQKQTTLLISHFDMHLISKVASQETSIDKYYGFLP